jgi:general stress protein 26
MIKIASQGLNEVWFSTNTSSARVRQFEQDGRACVYFVDTEAYEGLALTGTVTVRQDIEARRRCWFEGAERYYPLGLTDPDYCVLQFIAQQANDDHSLRNVTFTV